MPPKTILNNRRWRTVALILLVSQAGLALVLVVPGIIRTPVETASSEGRQPSPPETPPVSAAGRQVRPLRMRLLDEQGMQGLSGATVAVRSRVQGTVELRSDETGRLEAGSYAPGTDVDLFVGLHQPERRVVWHHERIAVPSDPDTEVVVTIPSWGLIRGQVVDSKGSAVPGAVVRVRVSHAGDVAGEEFRLFGRLTGGRELVMRSDEQGRFTIESTSPECFLTFGVAGWPRGSYRTTGSLKERPSGVGFDTVPRGEHSICITQVDVPHLSVTVLAAGLAVADAALGVFLEDPKFGDAHPLARTASTDTAGRATFFFSLRRGEPAESFTGRRFWLFAHHPEAGFGFRSGTYRLGDPEVAVALTEAALPLEGRVVNRGTDDGVPESEVLLQSDLFSGRVIDHGVTDGQGRFRFSVPPSPADLPPHLRRTPEYRVTVNPRAGTLTHVPVLVPVLLESGRETMIEVQPLPPKKRENR